MVGLDLVVFTVMYPMCSKLVCCDDEDCTAVYVCITRTREITRPYPSHYIYISSLQLLPAPVTASKRSLCDTAQSLEGAGAHSRAGCAAASASFVRLHIRFSILGYLG